MGWSFLHAPTEMDSKDVLAQNVQALLRARGMTIKQLVEISTKGGGSLTNGTAGRAYSGAMAIKLGNLDEIAKALDVAPWKLLVPGMSTEHMPELVVVGPRQIAFFEQLKQTREAIDGVLQTEGNTRPGGLD